MFIYKDNIITATKKGSNNDREVLRGGFGCFCFRLLKERFADDIIINGDTDEKETGGSLLTKSIRIALLLQKSGIKRGDIITCFAPIHQDVYAAVLGACFIGAIPSIIEHNQAATEIANLLKRVHPKLIVNCTQTEDALQFLRKAIEESAISFDIVNLYDCPEFSEPHKHESIFTPTHIDDLEETALIYFSSGSTGLPKGICIQHSVLNKGDNNALPKSGKDRDVVLSFDSLYWSSEMTKFVKALKTGTVLVTNPVFKPDEVWRKIHKYKVTAMGLPAFYAIQLHDVGKPDDVNADTVKHLYMLGSTLPKTFKDGLQKMLPNAIITNIYGSTEAGPITFYVITNPQHIEWSRTKPESCGVPVPGNIIKVVDPETGKALGPNCPGEVRLITPKLMKGYYNLDTSNEYDEEGFFKTGDIAYYDEDFCFFFVERIKQVIIYQGWHVIPLAIENRLMTHPAVRKAAVVGKKHEIDGERPTAFVELNEGYKDVDLNDIVKYAAETLSPPHKLTGGIIVIDKIPTTPTNKVKKTELKKMLEN